MFDLIKHLVKNDIHHNISDNGNITVTTIWIWKMLAASTPYRTI